MLVKSYILKLSKGWIQETVADIVGIFLYGPASYFSAEYISIYYSEQQYNNEFIETFSISHPRDSFRNNVKKYILEKYGFADHFPDGINEQIEKWDNRYYSIKVKSVDFKTGNFLVNNSLLTLIEEMIINNLDFIVNKVIENLPKNIIYNEKQFKDYALSAYNKLYRFIPPNELNNEPLDSISILNSGWLSYLLWKDEADGETRNLEDREIKGILNNLVRKALVSANIQRRWNDVCSIS